MSSRSRAHGRCSKATRPEPFPTSTSAGLAREGVAALKAFVEAGGTLVALDSASMMPIEQFKLPVKNVLEGLSGRGGGGGDSIGPDSAAFYAPGSIVKTEVDTKSPIAYGSDAESIALVRAEPGVRGLGQREGDRDATRRAARRC